MKWLQMRVMGKSEGRHCKNTENKNKFKKNIDAQQGNELNLNFCKQHRNGSTYAIMSGGPLLDHGPYGDQQ